MSFSVLLSYRLFSRGAGMVLVLAVLMTLPACWVTSINPLYEDGFLSSKDPDLAFDPSLTGSWTAVNDTCTTVMTVAAKDEVYDLQSTEQGEGCSSDKVRYQAHLVKLDSHYFFDISPANEDVCTMCLPKHNIFLAKFDKDTLSLIPIDSDWLKKSLAAKTANLETLQGDSDTLTASSKELKAFCRKFADNKGAFRPESTATFRRKPN
jgi:hypothetical protein